MRSLQYINLIHRATDPRFYLPQIHKTGRNKINIYYVGSCVPITENQILIAEIINEGFKN